MFRGSSARASNSRRARRNLSLFKCQLLYRPQSLILSQPVCFQSHDACGGGCLRGPRTRAGPGGTKHFINLICFANFSHRVALTCLFSILGQLLYRNVKRFRGGLVSKAHRSGLVLWRLRQRTMHVQGDVCEDLELAPGQEVSASLQTSAALQNAMELFITCCFSILEQLLYRHVQRFRGGLVFKAHKTFCFTQL